MGKVVSSCVELDALECSLCFQNGEKRMAHLPATTVCSARAIDTPVVLGCDGIELGNFRGTSCTANPGSNLLPGRGSRMMLYQANIQRSLEERHQEMDCSLFRLATPSFILIII